MTLRARILLLVLGILPACFGLIVIGISFEVLRANQAAHEQRRRLLIEASERIVAADLYDALAAIAPDAGITALFAVIDRLDRRRGEPDQLLRSWVLYLPDGALARGEPASIPDDPGARAEALASDRPVIRGNVVWRRLAFGSGGQAQAIGVLGLGFDLGFEGFDLARQIEIIAGVSVIGTIALVGLLLVLLSRMVLAPVAQLARAAQQVAAGDYSYRVPQPRRHDELARFVKVFNDMVAHVQGANAELEARVAEATARVRASEKQLSVAGRLAATGRLAAEIAHEINNPVGGMINAARSLRQKVDDNKLERERALVYLDLILDGLGRIEKTVKRVLAFARREAKPMPLAIVEPVRRALQLAEHRATARTITLVPPSGADAVMVYGDSGELEQVVLNLLLNAIDASRDGGRVWVRIRDVGDWVELDVEDEGVGMSAEVRERAFDPFYTTKPQGEGTGIGLAVVHSIVTRHAGEIHLRSAPNAGTTFTIRLPRHDPRAG